MIKWENTAHGIGKKKVLYKKGFADIPIIETSLSSLSFGEKVMLHQHESKAESYFFIEGNALMTIGDAIFNFKKNDFAIVPCGVLHSIENSGPDELVFLIHHIEIDLLNTK